MKNTLQFQIDQLRQDKIVFSVEAIAVIIFSFFVAIFLPQLLIRFVYANQQLFEEPVVLQYIPLVAFALGTAYFVYAMVGNVLRFLKIRALENQLAEFESCNCNDCNCGDMMCICGDDACVCCMPSDQNASEIAQLAEAVAKSAVKSKKVSPKAKTTTKKTTRKSNKK